MPAEVKRIYSGHADFNAVSREYTVALIESDTQTLIDVEMTLYTLPTVAPLQPGQAMIGGADYRFYFNDIDVTGALIKRLQVLAAALPKEKLKTQYLAGVAAYLRLMKALKTFDEEIKGDQDKANQIAGAVDWAGNFARLGDRAFGWSGNLHPLSFLYRSIQFPPLSLSDLWNTHRQLSGDNALPTTLSAVPLRSITFGQGPSARVQDFDATQHILGGRLVYQLEFAYVNPLREPLLAIQRRMKDLARDIETMRTLYLEPTLAKAEQARDDVTRLEQSLRERLEQLTDTVKQIG
jgi:hypothetical protein